jgi:hypothetical protein
MDRPTVTFTLVSICILAFQAVDLVSLQIRHGESVDNTVCFNYMIDRYASSKLNIALAMGWMEGFSAFKPW